LLLITSLTETYSLFLTEILLPLCFNILPTIMASFLPNNENDDFEDYLQDESYGRQPSLPAPNPYAHEESQDHTKPQAHEEFQDHTEARAHTESQAEMDRPSSLFMTLPPSGSPEYQEPDPDRPQTSIGHAQDPVAPPNDADQFGRLEDSDDDVEVIDPRTASEEAQTKWSVPKFTHSSHHSSVEVKTEPGHGKPTPSPRAPSKRISEQPGFSSQPSQSNKIILDILSAQRAMLQSDG
jgi:hypothetical protein